MSFLVQAALVSVLLFAASVHAFRFPLFDNPEPCPNGFYGYWCSRTCSEHCYGEENVCHRRYGACSCDPGYGGLYCTEREACRVVGTYGPHCNQTCSEHCRGRGHPCNRDSGACDRGCKPGWTGSNCDVRYRPPRRRRFCGGWSFIPCYFY